jgi:CO dehydrogenase/acetyl-CoA synthase beta subunit
MEGSCSTGQSPQWAVVPVEEEEEEEEEEQEEQEEKKKKKKKKKKKYLSCKELITSEKGKHVKSRHVKLMGGE